MRVVAYGAKWRLEMYTGPAVVPRLHMSRGNRYGIVLRVLWFGVTCWRKEK